MSRSKARINVPLRELTRLCARHHIRMLALFGSVLREDFGAHSDVDVTVDNPATCSSVR